MKSTCLSLAFGLAALASTPAPGNAVIEAVFKTAEVLDSKNWTEATEGKNAFVMFYAPWCGHCKKIKESYDSLAEDMKKNYSVIIAKVDCTKNHNKDLCKMYGIKSFPTLKYFNEQTDPRGGIYEGEREQWEMKKFLDEKFARTCSVVNLDLCPEAMQTELREYVDMDTETRAAALKQLTGEVDAAKERFRTDCRHSAAVRRSGREEEGRDRRGPTQTQGDPPGDQGCRDGRARGSGGRRGRGPAGR